MTDRERIGKLEELAGEMLMNLYNLKARQTKLTIRMDTLEEKMLELAKIQITLNDRQTRLQELMSDLTHFVRHNTTDIEIVKERMCTKEGLNNLFEVMMTGFDANKAQIDSMQTDIKILKER